MRMKKEICIAIDVGGTNLRLCMVDKAGRVLFRERHPTDIAKGRDAFLSRLFSTIGFMKDKGISDGWNMVGVGIGVPGLISNEGMIYSSVNLQPLEGLNLPRVITETTGLPSVIMN